MTRLVLLSLIIAGSVWAQPVEVRRGLTGEIVFEYSGADLTTVPQELDAPLLLRLERRRDDRYTAWFIGAVEGDFDLRELVCTRGGGEPVGLDPLPVSIVSNLPDSFETDLYDAADLRVSISGGYRLLLLILAGAWLAVPICVVVWRASRSRAAPEGQDAPARPTLAEQLRPLVCAAAERGLSVDEQARLELLLVHHWRERIAAEAPDVAAALAVIRRDGEAGELLSEIERWLHDPAADAHDPVRLETLLDPYREAAAIDEGETRDAAVSR